MCNVHTLNSRLMTLSIPQMLQRNIYRAGLFQLDGSLELPPSTRDPTSPRREASLLTRRTFFKGPPFFLPLFTGYGYRMIRIKQPSIADCTPLTDLVLRSKAHWGYDAAFMDACRDELAVRPEHIGTDLTRMACVSGKIAAYGRICGPVEEAELDALFVDPDYMGTGIGGRLLAHLMVLARSAGMRELEIAADPGAEGFYLRMGAVRTGEIPSGSIPGRTLPLLNLALV